MRRSRRPASVVSLERRVVRMICKCTRPVGEKEFSPWLNKVEGIGGDSGLLQA
jgi:hypothetical protein